MLCDKCKRDFLEEKIDESYDVPCYLFEGIGRKERKPKADKFGRHWLCKDCHQKYEEGLRMSLKVRAVLFSKKFFKEEESGEKRQES